MLREIKDGCYLDIEVIPNSDMFSILSYDPWIKRFKVRVRESPIKGRANKELVSEIQKLVESEVLIVNGLGSTKKTLFIRSKKGEIKKRLGI